MRLEINELSKTYGKVKALKDISLTLENGIYGILGPNGAGKSTLIRLLTDNLQRDRGSICWNGKDILDFKKDYRKLIGYMPQEQGYYEDFSAESFLLYMAQLKGMNRKEAKDAVKDMLYALHMLEHAKEPMGSFSGGMKQRILLAQALLNNPKILILDEPTAGVDPQERIRIRNFISEIAKDKIVILATHIVSDVEAVAKEIILLQKGTIIEKGTPYELLEKVKGHVFELEISNEQLLQIQSQYIISNLRQTKTGLAAKIIASEQPVGFEVKSTIANLEDVYLYFFEENNNTLFSSENDFFCRNEGCNVRKN